MCVCVCVATKLYLKIVFINDPALHFWFGERHIPGKQQSPGSSDMDPMVIGTAQAGANSCYAVVRAVAQSLLRIVHPET